MQKENNKSAALWQMASMTGMGRARVHNERMAFEVIAKSVNHRGLDIKIRLPSELLFLEAETISLVSSELGRGRVEIQATMDLLSEARPSFTISEEKVAHLMMSLDKLQDRFSQLSRGLSFGELVSLPGIVEEAKAPMSEADLSPEALRALSEAIKDLKASRAREGAMLGISLKEMLARSAELLSSIERDADADVKMRFERIRMRVSELFSDHKISEERLCQELALLAERSDYKEELDRLKAHTEHFDLLCRKPHPKGRKLDFLCQEMLRESNTLLSKASEHKTIIKALELKAEIERIREQVQNIE